ncbi:deoxynucleoside kinase [Alkalicoccobacillus plakortidis]|uniref:Deoxynucleoside kinase n=1 Tax=Alkalicoccobacillus plakortidis TaxID=444060 RepID=A0ABT0XHI5_9BACI|nr:deoxynucleoside kinase [Alkalicoccobacillus plakortidis]MCM2675378.1 deoxynucleoside kinase [Alkalicoccobacillus plakortidis]
MSEHTPFIVVEGPIGVGKTTLTKLLAAEFSYASLTEIVEENPFLGKFYENIEEWSFQTEMFFLCNRYKQLEDTAEKLQAGVPVVADYHIFKNLIFARRTLPKDQLDKYIRIYNILTEEVPEPTAIVYIHASLPTLLKRINQRGRSIEQHIEPEYLEQLITDYEEAIASMSAMYPHVPIIKIDGDNYDYVENQSDLDYIYNLIREIT